MSSRTMFPEELRERLYPGDDSHFTTEDVLEWVEKRWQEYWEEEQKNFSATVAKHKVTQEIRPFNISQPLPIERYSTVSGHFIATNQGQYIHPEIINNGFAQSIQNMRYLSLCDAMVSTYEELLIHEVGMGVPVIEVSLSKGFVIEVPGTILVMRPGTITHFALVDDVRKVIMVCGMVMPSTFGEGKFEINLSPIQVNLA